MPGMRPAPIYSGSRRIGCSVKKWLVKASVVALYIDGDWAGLRLINVSRGIECLVIGFPRW